MGELPAQIDLLSRDFASQLLADMTNQGQLPTFAEPMHGEIVDAAFAAISSPIGRPQPCGCVEISGPFAAAITVQERAQLAVGRFAKPYEAAFRIGDPKETLNFITTSDYLKALTAVGSLTALLEERGRLALEAGAAFLDTTYEQPDHSQHK